ncbi:MAG TPA: aldo/keto reductase [archaeon]|nr:aldo/keto reductase [archaeon]
MKYRTLGRTGLKVSEIGFGCWGIGGSMWKSKDEDSRKALKKAIDVGINFFDTAWVYGEGHSEKLVGELAKEHDIIIATKIPPKNRMWPGTGDIDQAFPKDHVLDFARKSFQNLGKIDLLQLHVWRDEWLNDSGWREALDILKKEGVADYFGVSISDHAPQTALKLASSGKIDSLQVIFSIFDQSPAEKLFKVAKKNNLGIIVRCPFDEGSLCGKFTYETKFNDWRDKYFRGERLKETVDRVNKLKFLENKRTLAQAALQFCLSNDAVSTVIPGMRKEEHVVVNAKACEGSLTLEELNQIKNHRWNKNFYDAL